MQQNSLSQELSLGSAFRYLLLEFPQLMVQEPPQHFVEIGCGCGSSIIPVLKANATCRATVSDLSPTAVAMLKQGAESAGISKDRILGFEFDATDLQATSHQRELTKI